MKQRFDVVVAGGGMVGLAIAGFLAAREQLRITVIDAGQRPVFDPHDDVSLRVSAIAPGSVGILEAIGAWSEIVGTRACPYRDMKVWDAAGHVDGPETLIFSAADFAVPQLGFIVENALTQCALLGRLEQANVAMRFDEKINAVIRSGNRYEVELHSGDKLRPDVLIGADGANSFVRECAGIDVELLPHAQKAFVTSLQPELGHRNTAWQRFMKEGPIGILPLQDGRVSIVWSTTPENAESALGMADEALSARLTDVTDGVLGRLRPVGPRGAFPLNSRHAKEYVRDGMVLIGDAAHAIHPLAGQGVNLGFADAEELDRVIGNALQAGENPGDLPTLRRFQRARKGANATMLHFMDSLNKLFSNDSAVLANLRGAGMYAFNKSGPVRDRVVQVALGIH